MVAIMNKIQADSLRRSIKLINLQQDSLGEGRKGGREKSCHDQE